jgi:hypothetical protein
MTGSPPPALYELQGLRIRSEIPFGEPAPDGPHDLAVSWSRDTSGQDPPERRLLAEAVGPGGRGYRHVETAAGYRLQFRDVCDILVASDRRSLTVRLAAGADPQMIPIFLEGNVLAVLLLLAGARVLHASGVRVGGRAVAFVGGSGVGKSTLAALCCAAGAAWFTDDLLQVVPDGDGFRCLGGSREVRLRSGAMALAALFPDRPSRPTGDGRLAVCLGEGSASSPQLAAIVSPVRADSRHARVERLAPLDAWCAVLGAPRVLGLRDSGLLRAQFETATELARRVPVYRAEVPAGPPFEPSVGTELLAGVRLT